MTRELEVRKPMSGMTEIAEGPALLKQLLPWPAADALALAPASLGPLGGRPRGLLGPLGPSSSMDVRLPDAHHLSTESGSSQVIKRATGGDRRKSPERQAGAGAY